jgi:hypothetical protein
MKKIGRIGGLEFGPDEVLAKKPSEYFAQSVWVGVSFPSPREAQARHAIGIEKFMWGSDYPHSESTYPYTTEALRLSFSGVHPAELRALLAGNAAHVYDFDLSKLAALAAKVGPRVAEVAQPLEARPADATSPAFHPHRVSWSTQRIDAGLA